MSDLPNKILFCKKTDIIATLIACFMFMGLAAITISTAGAYRPTFLNLSAIEIWIIVIAMPVLSIVGLIFANILARRRLIFLQLFKFLIVGGLNTIVDLGVFNILKLSLGVSGSGVFLTGIKGVSFIVAMINSFLWNKFWVFEKSGGKKLKKEAGTFFAVSFMAMVLNTGVFYVLTTLISPPAGMSALIWHNIAVILAALSAFIWNFLGYRLIVFKNE